MFYQFDQNNSYGVFDVTETLCHRLFIEADNQEEAIEKAEELGCYWDGVEKGIDCPCCGDRWHEYCDEVDLDTINAKGWLVSANSKDKWEEKFGKYQVIQEPYVVKGRLYNCFDGRITFRNIEEYAQVLADLYGWTRPDARIFYNDGKILEVFKHEDMD